MSRELRNVIAVCVLFLFLGLGFASWGVHDIWETRAFVASAQRTTGRVVAFESRLGRRASVSVPVYEFADRNGRIHRATSITGSSSEPYSIGSDISIFYDPRDP